MCPVGFGGWATLWGILELADSIVRFLVPRQEARGLREIVRAGGAARKSEEVNRARLLERARRCLRQCVLLMELPREGGHSGR